MAVSPVAALTELNASRVRSRYGYAWAKVSEFYSASREGKEQAASSLDGSSDVCRDPPHSNSIGIAVFSYVAPSLVH